MLSESSDRDREAMMVNTWEESMPDSQQVRQEFDEYLVSDDCSSCLAFAVVSQRSFDS